MSIDYPHYDVENESKQEIFAFLKRRRDRDSVVITGVEGGWLYSEPIDREFRVTLWGLRNEEVKKVSDVRLERAAQHIVDICKLLTPKTVKYKNPKKINLTYKENFTHQWEERR